VLATSSTTSLISSTSTIFGGGKSFTRSAKLQQTTVPGDGFVWLDNEMCDDANLDDTDDCPTSCQPAFCGDGFVLANTEQCDDANDNDMDGCLADCTAGDFLFEAENQAVNLAIPDDGYTGAQDSMACTQLEVDAVGSVGDITPTFTINHTWVGDTTGKLISPAGTVITLWSRPGLVEAADDGGSCCGDSTNFSAMAPISFNAAFSDDAETMGNTLATGQSVCLDDMRCEYLSNPGAALAGGLDTLVGEAVNGSWTFCVSDSGGGDQGQLVGVGLSIQVTAP
jgi:cysteine-rich repeat protein